MNNRRIPQALFTGGFVGGAVFVVELTIPESPMLLIVMIAVIAAILGSVVGRIVLGKVLKEES
ncbi:hypothetical protein [Alteribacter aurantiacus]|uniref:hypothetical protein n=1 Tax=Alteribacter aurantiacus TaxID=254410 RepID=UPI0004085000|nr:hypothetical protein [Alteribacter aurantiacus]